MDKRVLTKIIIVIAKVSSLLTIGFLLIMLLGHIFDPGDETSNEKGFETIELIAALFFPIGTVIGMAIGWKKNLAGGLITIVSTIIFSFLILIPREVNFERGSWIFLLLSFPGFLFTLAGLLKRTNES